MKTQPILLGIVVLILLSVLFGAPLFFLSGLWIPLQDIHPGFIAILVATLIASLFSLIFSLIMTIYHHWRNVRE